MTLKASKHEDESEGIVISFHSKWLPLLSGGEINCVFRKRGPRRATPRWIYVYVSTPTKAIVGRLPIKKIEEKLVEDCINQSSAGAIGRDELAKYAEGYNKLFVFTVGIYQLAKTEADFDHLSTRFGFYPPQSFLFLSTKGKKQLDKLCGFQD